MLFATRGSAAAALAASLASASAIIPAQFEERTPHGVDLPNGLDLSKPINAVVDLGIDLSHKTLFAGLIADISVPPVVGVGADVEALVGCQNCYTKGTIDASVSLEKLVPTLSLSLKDIEVLLELDVKLGAAATIAVNLLTPDIVLSLPLPGVSLEAKVYLDLIIGAHTEVDLSAGVYAQLAEEALLEIDILSADIINAAFSGLAVKVLPIKVRIGCTEVLVDLRLRVDLGLALDLDVDDLLPLDELIPGLDLPSVGAGLELAVFANLLEYVGLFCDAPECPLAKESYGLNVGAAVDLDVELEGILDLSLAPTISTVLLSVPTNTICVPSLTPSPTPTISIPTSSVPTSSMPATSNTASGSSSASSGTSSGSSSSSAASSGTAASSSSDSPSGSSTAAGPTTSSAYTTSANSPATTPGAGEYITSTIIATETYTITACAVNVPNCPGGYQTTQTVIHTASTVTVYPVSQTGSFTILPISSFTPDIVTITKHVTTLVPCSTVGTFTPPTELPTPYPTSVPAGSNTYPVGTQSVSYPAGSSSVTYPAGSSLITYPAGSSSVTYPVGPSSATYPAGYPSASYPAGSSSVTYPTGSSSVTYPAGSPSVSYPAGSPSSPPVYPTSVPVITAPVYPTGGNGTIPSYTTFQPSASTTYSVPSYLTNTPVPAGAAKVGSGIAGAVAVVGAMAAFL